MNLTFPTASDLIRMSKGRHDTDVLVTVCLNAAGGNTHLNTTYHEFSFRAANAEVGLSQARAMIPPRYAQDLL